MRGRWPVLLLLLLLMLGAACGEAEAPPATEAPTTTTTQPPTTTTQPPTTTTTSEPPTTAEEEAEEVDQVAVGKKLSSRYGCAACHSADGSAGTGPTWKGLFGRERPLADGSTVMADEAYLRESILDPNAQIAQGFTEGIMPEDFDDKLTDEEIDALIEYIKSLS